MLAALKNQALVTFFFIASVCVLLISCGPKDINISKKVDSSAVIAALEQHGLELNKHYKILDKGVSHSDEKIIVSEYFWYGCSHCLDVDPVIKKWKIHLPENAEVLRIPVVWQPIMNLHAKVFYVAEQLLEDGELTSRTRQKLHESLFPVIMNLRSEQREKNQLASIRSHFTRFGISQDKFDELYESDAIKQQAVKAKSWQKISSIESTPIIIIDGIYKLNHHDFESKEDLIVYGNQIVNAIAESKSLATTEE